MENNLSSVCSTKLRHGKSRFVCPFCDTALTRRDSLNRHWRTCNARISRGASIPSFPGRPRGKKRKACDQCSRLKRACNAQNPCGTCAAKQLECSYIEFQNSKSISNDLLMSGAMPTPASQDSSELDMLFNFCDERDCRSPISLDGEIVDDWAEFSLYHSLLNMPLGSFYMPPHQNMKVSRSRFDFLFRFTSVSGLYKSFTSEAGVKIPKLSDAKPPPGGSLENEISWFDIFGDIQLEPAPQTESISYWGHQQAAHPLTLKTFEIVSKLKETVDNRSRRSPISFDWSPHIETACIEFFSPENISIYLDNFWTYWYPNCPTIHKPSFDSRIASSALLASMATLGSCFSSSASQNPKFWLDCVEEMVFDGESIQEEHLNMTPGGNVCDQMSFEILQAAYFVCLFQNWEGSINAKQRIRRHRFSTVVAASRNLAISQSPHQDFQKENKFDWKHFIKIEERIRTFSYIFLLDTAFVIFNNAPPRMFVAELEIGVNCPEVCFQAHSANDCLEELKRWTKTSHDHHHPLTLKSSIEGICKTEITTRMQEAYSQLGMLNLFVIVSAMCSSIYQLQNSLVPPSAFQNIERGMDRWKVGWDAMQALHGPVEPRENEVWRRDGFMKCAPEYWLLGRVILKKIQSSSSTESSGTMRILGKYDQTDMGQVNNLIAQFNDMVI